MEILRDCSLVTKCSVTFEKISESVDLPFTDLAEEAWYSGAVEYVYAHGLMRGMSETVFSPNTSLTRAQAVQILYNLEGQPVVSGAATFTDAEHWAKRLSPGRSRLAWWTVTRTTLSARRTPFPARSLRK